MAGQPVDGVSVDVPLEATPISGRRSADKALR